MREHMRVFIRHVRFAQMNWAFLEETVGDSCILTHEELFALFRFCMKPKVDRFGAERLPFWDISATFSRTGGVAKSLSPVMKKSDSAPRMTEFDVYPPDTDVTFDRQSGVLRLHGHKQNLMVGSSTRWDLGDSRYSVNVSLMSDAGSTRCIGILADVNPCREADSCVLKRG